MREKIYSVVDNKEKEIESFDTIERATRELKDWTWIKGCEDYKVIERELINKEDFMAYEDVREMGIVNMITGGSMVAMLIGLSKKQYMYLLDNYDALKEKYLK